ncbi:signal peptide peptidase SppA [Nocardioides sp.]|uniref:signal peptide peptidase SppA n=1 Tax=Nocardioides sp. TaxID=35761 RepID=UPI0035141E44
MATASRSTPASAGPLGVGRLLRLPGRAAGPRTVLEIDLSDGVVLRPPATPLEALRLRQAPSLRALREGLQRAATDDAVLGLQVHVGSCPLTLPEVDEVGDLIEEFGRHKPTLAWTESFGELLGDLPAYRLAVRAERIWVQPTGTVGLTGAAMAVTLLRGGFDKLGIEPQFGQRHEYKSAADQFAAPEITPAVREMVQRLVDSVVEDTVALVARRRGLDVATVRALIERAPLSAADALAAGLVDHLGYHADLQEWCRATWTPAWEPRYVHRYAADTGSADALRTLARGAGAAAGRPARGERRIGVVDVTGPIVMGPGTSRQAGGERIAARLRALREDDDVAGVLLRVDSPGGSYIASDAIRAEVRALRGAGRPVIAQMRSVAASGGYFVAMGADEIVAQPTTITGSIGVLGGKFVLRGLLDRLGIVRETVTSGPQAALMAADRPFTEQERAVLEGWLDDVYADFTTKAAADRGLPLDELEPHARGRVWTGADAHARSLVDHLGGTRVALARLAERLDTSPDRLRLRAPGPLDVLRQLRPADSSRDRAAARGVGVEALAALGARRGPGGLAAVGAVALAAALEAGDAPGAVLAGRPGGGPEALLVRAATRAGLHVPAGVLSLPWDLAPA